MTIKATILRIKDTNTHQMVEYTITNGFVSDFIPAAFGDVIRAKSVNTAFENSYPVIFFYKADKTYIGGLYANSTTNVVLSSDGKEFSCDSGLLNSSASSYGGTAYVRVMGYGSPDGFIITKNEPIE